MYKLYMYTYVHVHVHITLFDQHYIKNNKNLRYLINYWAKAYTATYKCTCTNCTCTHMYIHIYVHVHVHICACIIILLVDITIFITGYMICIIYCECLMRFTIFTFTCTSYQNRIK